MSGTTLLWIGLAVCVLGLVFGLTTYSKLRKLPVHQAMHEVSELIYTTCKTYLKQQARFLMVLWAFIAIAVVEGVMGLFDGRIVDSDSSNGTGGSDVSLNIGVRGLTAQPVTV